MVKHFFSRTKKALRLNLGIQCLGLKVFLNCSSDVTRIMPLTFFTVWSDLCLSCYGSTLRNCMAFADMQ